jgi:predicted nucleotidyltransferase
MADSSLNPQLQVILRTLRQKLAQALGDQLEQVVLYGSRARGEARPDSDIDVLVVVRGDVNYPDLMQRTSVIVADVSLQYDVVISRTFASRAQYETAHNPFFINVRREGVAV